MKIILSPSKLQKNDSVYTVHKKIISQKKTNVLLKVLQSFTYDEIARFFSLKNQTLDTIYQLYNTDQAYSGDAFGTYNGIVFKEVNTTSYDSVQRAFLLKHGIVLSALYGILEPDMAIRPYRLDMTKKLKDIQLYDYWQPEVDQYFKDVSLVINLASVEFSKMLKNYKGRMVNIYFKEEQFDGKLKIVTVRAKQARGLMFDYIISHCISNTEDLKTFQEAGYCYDATHSSDDALVFIKAYDSL